MSKEHPTGDELAQRGLDKKPRYELGFDHKGEIAEISIMTDATDGPTPIAGLDVLNDGGTLKPRPKPVEHDWRLWPITWLGLDVVCIGCGQNEMWPLACGGNELVPANFDPERDWGPHLDVMAEGAWISDALPCGYRATARTAERARAACISHLEEHHG